MSPRGDLSVITKIKRRLEEKTSSSSPLAPTPPSQNANKFDDDKPKSEKAELIELIQESTGLAPDRRLVRDITEQLELRGIRLRQYLDDIRPRLLRLKDPPGPGFFLSHATRWRDSRPAEKPPHTDRQGASHCSACSSTGRTPQGYCGCSMGRDLAIAEKKIAKAKSTEGRGHMSPRLDDGIATVSTSPVHSTSQGAFHVEFHK